MRLASTRRQKVLCLFGVCALSALLGRVDATDPPPPGAPDLPTCGFSDVGCSNANGAKQTCACFAVAGVNFFNCDEQSSECSPWTIYTAGVAVAGFGGVWFCFFCGDDQDGYDAIPDSDRGGGKSKSKSKSKKDKHKSKSGKGKSKKGKTKVAYIDH